MEARNLTAAYAELRRQIRDLETEVSVLREALSDAESGGCPACGRVSRARTATALEHGIVVTRTCTDPYHTDRVGL
jgi:hypothetical protein